MNVAELVRIMSFKIYIITIIIKYDFILKILSNRTKLPNTSIFKSYFLENKKLSSQK